jgi:hypothetical protein
MDGDDRLFRALLEQPDLERQVRRQTGNRCEGLLDNHEDIPSIRCARRGAAVDLYLSFQGWLGDEIAAEDIRLLCAECYDSSETAEQFAHLDHMLSKND